MTERMKPSHLILNTGPTKKQVFPTVIRPSLVAWMDHKIVGYGSYNWGCATTLGCYLLVLNMAGTKALPKLVQ